MDVSVRGSLLKTREAQTAIGSAWRAGDGMYKLEFSRPARHKSSLEDFFFLL